MCDKHDLRQSYQNATLFTAHPTAKQVTAGLRLTATKQQPGLKKRRHTNTHANAHSVTHIDPSIAPTITFPALSTTGEATPPALLLHFNMPVYESKLYNIPSNEEM